MLTPQPPQNQPPQKKFRLNQRHWLNIIILMISLMLVFSVLVGRMMNKPVEPVDIKSTIADSPLAMSQKLKIIQLDFGETQFNLFENEWASSNKNGSNKNYSKEKLLIIIDHWQALLREPGNPFSQKINTGKTVLIYLTNLEQPLVAKINIMESQLQISFINQKLEFYLPIEKLSLYYPDLNN